MRLLAILHLDNPSSTQPSLPSQLGMGLILTPSLNIKIPKKSEKFLSKSKNIFSKKNGFYDNIKFFPLISEINQNIFQNDYGNLFLVNIFEFIVKD